MKNLGQLLIKIEKLRSEMHRLATEKGFAHKEVLQVSQEMDSLLNQYYKIKNPSQSLTYDIKDWYALKTKKSKVRPSFNYFYVKRNSGCLVCNNRC